jgi:hypothetical protein
MSYIYYEDNDTGLLSFWNKIGNIKSFGDIQIITLNGYNPSTIKSSLESKNYVNSHVDKTIKTIVLSDEREVNIEISKGKINKVIMPDNTEL